MTDPTNTIATAEQAQVLAHAMLRLAPDPSEGLWQTISEPMLTVLLHTASPAGRGGGLPWVDTAVNALATTDSGDAAGAVGISDAAARSCLSRLNEFSGRQRDSIIVTLRQAVTPWAAAPA
jgi:hypothetical protein